MFERIPERKIQTRMGTGGNCFSACLAMLLGIPVDEVPAFVHLFDSNDWDKCCQSWLLKHFGLRMICVHVGGEEFMPPLLVGNGVPYGVYLIGSGKAARGYQHAVVGRINEMKWETIFDPHPDDTGLIGFVDFIYFLLPQNPVAYVDNRRELEALREIVNGGGTHE